MRDKDKLGKISPSKEVKINLNEETCKIPGIILCAIKGKTGFSLIANK